MSDWSRAEVDFIVADYFSMLRDEIAGKRYNKSEHRRRLAPLLNDRAGAIEFKHRNISAALIDLGLPFIAGYKPLHNYQSIVQDAIFDYLNSNKRNAEIQFEQFSDKEITPSSPIINFSNFIVAPPVRQELSEPTIKYNRKPFKINYLEREQRNSSLGEQGEQLVINYEKWLLAEAGKQNLADRIEWISKEDDGAGFDILSKNINGTDKYIEVKTTKLSKEAPFFFSKTEYNFSKENAQDFHLYRLFQFTESPKMFVAEGSYDSFCYKEPILYKGSF